MSDHDEIRAKRLARLEVQGANTGTGAVPVNPPQTTTGGASTTPVDMAMAKGEKLQLPQTVLKGENLQTPQTVLKGENLQTPQTVLAGETLQLPQTALAGDNVAASSAWVAVQLETLLCVSLTPHATLPHLEAAGALDAVGPDDVEQILMELLVERGVANPFEYLRECWTRASHAKRLVPPRDPARVAKLAFLAEIVRLCPAYGLICIQEPDMFLHTSTAATLGAIVNDPRTDFVSEVAVKAHENDFLLEFLNVVVPHLLGVLAGLSLNEGRYGHVITLFQVLVAQRPVAAVFTQITGFHPHAGTGAGIGATEFETRTLLGPVLRLLPLDPAVAVQAYAHATTATATRAVSEGLQAEHNTLVSRLFYICDKIVRGSPTSRRDLVQYFAALVNANHLRRAERADRALVAGDGIMVNATLVLALLAQPFLDASLTRLDKIDVDFFARRAVLDIASETRLNATLEEAKAYDAHDGAAANFVLECFFLTLAFLHYGVGGCFTQEERLKAMREQLEAQLLRLTELAERAGRDTGAPSAAVVEAHAARARREKQACEAQLAALASFFANGPQQANLFDVVAGACAFLVRAAAPGAAALLPLHRLQLPLVPDNLAVRDDADALRRLAPSPWRFYPELVIEGIVNYCAHAAHHPRNPLAGNARVGALAEFAVVMLRCPELVSNPHLKCKLVEALFFGALPSPEGHPGFMALLFEANQTCRDHLLYALLDFYVAVEKTGASSQFYDKFNARYHISMVLEQLWKTPVYRNQLRGYLRNDVAFFVRFVARMLNDTTFLLDEAYGDLYEIHALQNTIAGNGADTGAHADTVQENGAPTDAPPTDAALRLEAAERRCRNYVQLSNKTLELFRLFTSEVPRAFVLPEIVDRLAGMLDYNLAALVGPKCRDLKVQSPEKYAFDPKRLLGHFCHVFINLGGEREFVEAVARDGRSFERALFERAETLATRYHLLPTDAVAALTLFANNAEAQRQADVDEELELGDVPDDFLDPLMYTVMSDPVVLPGSKMSIDRSTIKSHLLSDATDPFNRQPLRLEDVQDDVELKRRITEWRATKRRAL